MSKEQPGVKPDEINVTIKESLSRLSEQSTTVQGTVTQALKNGSVDLPSVIAALELSGKLSATMQSFLENQGQVVFSDRESLRPPTDENDGEDKHEPILPEGPKTFGELLRFRIDDQLLPVGKDSFLKSDLFEIAKNKNAVKKAAVAEKFSVKKRLFTREEAIQILYCFFITPSSNFKNIQQSYSLQEFKKSHLQAGSVISELSQEINHDWLQNPTIDFQTAMELKGLINLKRVLSGEKVARMGHSGAQFGRKSADVSTLSTEPAFPYQP